MDYMKYFDTLVTNADLIIDKLFSEMTPIYKEEHKGGLDVVVPLFRILHYSTKSILMLLSQHDIFDADVLFRTVLEGTIKYCYLMNGTLEQRFEKYKEYRNVLTDIGKIGEHNKALDAISVLREFSSNDTRPIELCILEEDELVSLNEKYPAKMRNQIIQKWSYRNLLRALAAENETYKKQLGTLWSYAQGSHQIHLDYFGLFNSYNGILDDDSNTIDLIGVGSGLRLLVSVLTLESLRMQEYVRCNRFINATLVTEVVKLDELIEAVNQELNDFVNEQFHMHN